MKWLHVVLAALVFLPVPMAVGARVGDEAAWQAGKARLVQKIEADIGKIREAEQELRDYLAKGGRLPLVETQIAIQSDPNLVLRGHAEHRQALGGFLEIVRQERAERVPALLYEVLQSCERGYCRDRQTMPELLEFFVAFGSTALHPALDGLAALDTAKKESVLNLLLRAEPALCPEPVLDLALDDPVFRVRAAAISVYHTNCEADSFYENLARLLGRETDPDSLLFLLDLIPDDSPRNVRVFDQLVKLVQGGRLPVKQVFGKLCAWPMQHAALDAAAVDTGFWLEAFEHHEGRRACLVQNVFLRLHEGTQLAQLHRLFREAAEYRYGFGATQGLYGLVSPPRPAYWQSIPHRDEQMLALFSTRLRPGDLQAWMTRPDASLGERLLLARWLGRDVAALLPGTLRLDIEVYSAANTAVSASRHDIVLNRPFQFVDAPLAQGFQPVDYRGVVRFDADRLGFTVESLTLGLEPAGASFDARIPVSGSFEGELLVRQGKFRWKIRLAPQVDR